MVRYTLEQCVFMYDTYVKFGSAGKCRRKFRRKFHDERVPSRQTIHNLLNKLRTTGLKRRVLTEETLDDIGSRLEHTPRKSLKRLAKEIVVSKCSARTATQLLKPSSEVYVWCAVSARRIVVPVFFNEKFAKNILWSVNCKYLIPNVADCQAKFACASRQAAHRPP
jgi:hypothetical protein